VFGRSFRIGRENVRAITCFARLVTVIKAEIGKRIGKPNKTVATLLENAGVKENVAADIIGHDKPTITCGLYSGGNSLAVKQAAIEKLRYAT
jgi:hypothetical protein